MTIPKICEYAGFFREYLGKGFLVRIFGFLLYQLVKLLFLNILGLILKKSRLLANFLIDQMLLRLFLFGLLLFYVLLCLKEECYGLDILERVHAMTGNRVSVGSGTLYNLLEQFLAEGMIIETKVEGRRRSYILTCNGKEMLDK